MSRTYKAALIHGPGDVRVEQVPWVDPGRDEVVVEIHQASICPSDLRDYRGVKAAEGARRVGHEYAGVVIATGSDVKSFRAGDRVVPQSWTPCGQCYNCRRGKYSACENRISNFGGFAEYTVVKENSLLRIPGSTSFGAASVTEPLASILKADQEISKVTLGDTVVIYGLGPMGCMHMQSSKLLGGWVIGIDLLRERRELAKKLGADAVIDPQAEDPVTRVKELTSGRGADVVLVTVGGRAEAACTMAALQMANFAGRINIYAGTYPTTLMDIDPNVIHYGELTVSGTRSYNPRTFALALELIASGRVNVEAIRYPIVTLDEIKHGMDIHGTREAMKVGVSIKED